MFDVLIVNGKVSDGVSDEFIDADVAIAAGRIAEIGKLADAEAARTVDASGHVVCPGFVDIHNHASGEVMKGIFDCDNLVRQGITTIVAANCGEGPWPIGPNLDEVDAHGMRQNYALLIGHRTIRMEAMGKERYSEFAGYDDIRRMQQMVEQGMEEGAFGVTGGYPPRALTTEEIIEVCRPLARIGGFYAAHIRNESRSVIRALAEMVEIAEGAGIPVEISHLKNLGPGGWGKLDICLALIDDARERGLDVTADWYPYPGFYGGSNNIMPRWARAEAEKRGGFDALKEPDIIDRFREGVDEMLGRVGGPERLLFASRRDPDPEIDLKSPAQLADEWDCDLVDVAIEISKRPGVGAIGLAMREEDLVRILPHPAVMIGTDGDLEIYRQFACHPRNYGTFPRVLAKYVREQGVVSLSEAIRKMTSMPAEKVGLKDRGVLAAGKVADLVVFSPEAVQDNATFGDAHQYPDGIPYVLVGGEFAVDGGQTTDRLLGRALRREG